MERAKVRVHLERSKNGLEAELADINEKIARLKELQLDDVIEERIPEKCGVDGASLFVFRQLWAGPAPFPGTKKGDHGALSEVLAELEMDWLLPSNVNSQSFSAFVREHLDPDTKKPLEERLLNDVPKPLDPRLWKVMKASETIEVRVQNAGLPPGSTTDS